MIPFGIASLRIGILRPVAVRQDCRSGHGECYAPGGAAVSNRVSIQAEMLDG
jgi:hypothetical protein